jgi:hypothetical protein
MKGLAGLGVAGFIAGSVLLWFMTKPALVVTEAKPLTPNAAFPTFKHMANDHQVRPVLQQSE